MSTSPGTSFSLRQKIGALLIDVPRFLWAVYGPTVQGAHWTRYGNRRDRLRFDSDGRGVACDWESTRTLHLCDVFPWSGRRLLTAALRDCPIRFMETPGPFASTSAAPDVCFIIGHRGEERLPHLLLVLKSIAAQQDVRFECIVVEQDMAPLVRDRLPGWVKYVHAPVSSPETPYIRSLAFNVGARLAAAPLLVFHDDDMLVPAEYAAEILRCRNQGYEVINLKRFIFYLAKRDGPGGLFAWDEQGLPMDAVIENLEAGGSVAITREAFEAIGGFDEDFVGWGGEDVEFWQRARTRRVWNFGYLPLVHLWHPSQPGKYPKKRTPGMERLRQLSAIPPEQRIRALREAGGGGAGRP